MKKEVKRLRISTTGLVLMVMVAFGSLFSSCYTKDDIPVVPEVEPVKNTYVISGKLVGFDYATMQSDRGLSGVTVTSTPAAAKIEVANGSYAVYVNGGGSYTLSFSKEGYENNSCTVIVPEATTATGQMVLVTADVTLFKKLGEPSTTGAITVRQGGSISHNESTLSFPAYSVWEDVQVGMEFDVGFP